MQSPILIDDFTYERPATNVFTIMFRWGLWLVTNVFAIWVWLVANVFVPIMFCWCLWLVASGALPSDHTLKSTYIYQYDDNPSLWWSQKCFFDEVSVPTPPKGANSHKITFRVDGASSDSSFETQIKNLDVEGVPIGDNKWTPNDNNLHWEKVIDVQHDKPWNGKLCIRNSKSVRSSQVRLEMRVVKTLTMQVDGDQRIKRAQDELVRLYSNLGSKLSFPLKTIGYDPLPSVDIEYEADVELHENSRSSSSQPGTRNIHRLPTGVAPTTEDFTLVTGGKSGGQNQLFTGFVGGAVMQILDKIRSAALWNTLLRKLYILDPSSKDITSSKPPGVKKKKI